jgi:hypothetical protein
MKEVGFKKGIIAIVIAVSQLSKPATFLPQRGAARLHMETPHARCEACLIIDGLVLKPNQNSRCRGDHVFT